MNSTAFFRSLPPWSRAVQPGRSEHGLREVRTFADCELQARNMTTAEKNKRATASQQGFQKRAWELICTALAMTELYEDNKAVTAKYVHATSRGHEVIQIACGLQLKPWDYVFPYYRDDSILLSIGMEPYELMLQLLAKRDDPFSGGRTYYSHPSLRRDDMPKIPHNSSATGMQAIPSTGTAMGIKYMESKGLLDKTESAPLVVCSIGDAAMTEGEVSEALQMAALKQLPIIYLVQDNEWDISASADEIRSGNAAEYARGFKGLEARSIDGTDLEECRRTMEEVFDTVRRERRPECAVRLIATTGTSTWNATRSLK